jgi:hypothetical protein
MSFSSLSRVVARGLLDGGGQLVPGVVQFLEELRSRGVSL